MAGSHKYHWLDCDPTPQQPRDHRPLIHVPGGGPLPSRPGSEYSPPLHSPTPAGWPGPSTLLTHTGGGGGLCLSPLLTHTGGGGGLCLSPLSLLILAKNCIRSGLQRRFILAVEVGGLRRQKEPWEALSVFIRAQPDSLQTYSPLLLSGF